MNWLCSEHEHRSALRGFTLVDVIVGVSLLLIFFLSLFGLLRASLIVSSLAKGAQDATAIAQTQMEYLRGLSYDDLGTVNGIPSGLVPQYATTTENDLEYVTHTFISFVDDPADGTGSSDANGVTTDYKQARVETSYTVGAKKKSVVLDSAFAPPGIETSNGGGTLLINVVNASGDPVSGASVRIMNVLTTPTINVTTASNVNGQVYLSGAATTTGYQILVTKGGYSSAETYAHDSVNENPSPGHLTVVKDETTTSTFAIDVLSHLGVKTFAPVATSTFLDSFADATHLASMSSTTVSGDSIFLNAGEPTGTAMSLATTSSYLRHWGDAFATSSIDADSSVRIHIYSGGALVPDSALPGNSAGFTSFPVSLYALSTTTYPTLALGAVLTTSSGVSPSLDEWALTYSAGPVPLPNVAFTVTGAKTKGSKGDGTPLYKNSLDASTDSEGNQGLNVEWDAYKLSVPDYDIIDACPSPPYSLSPGNTLNTTLTLGSPSSNYARVFVTDNTGAILQGVSITLSKAGYSKTKLSSACGSAYFSALANSAYQVEISKVGYTTTDLSDVPVSGATTINASFP